MKCADSMILLHSSKSQMISSLPSHTSFVQRESNKSSYKSAPYLISLYVRECSRDSFLLFEMLFCVTLGRSCSYGVYMAMGHNSICKPISSVDVLFLNHYPHLFNILYS